MEHVFGGVRADTADSRPRGTVVTVDVHSVVGESPSIVQVMVDAMPEQPPEEQKPAADKRQEYESDRRGEHQYPHEEDRPSQRERDELKERLERGR